VVRGIEDLAPSAFFLASAYLARPLVSTILLPIAMSSFEASLSLALTIGHLQLPHTRCAALWLYKPLGVETGGH